MKAVHGIKIHKKQATGSHKNLCFTGLVRRLMMKAESVEKERDTGYEGMLVSNQSAAVLDSCRSSDGRSFLR